jgi:dihydrofolate reductase
MTEDGVIGSSQVSPLWHLPADLAHFKTITTGHPVIMGRKVHEIIGRPLSNRQNIILTRQPDYVSTGCEVAHSLDEALLLTRPDEEAFIIGGGEIFKEALPLVNKLYVTLVKEHIDGDIIFSYDKAKWHIVNQEDHQPDAVNKYSYSFLTLERAIS